MPANTIIYSEKRLEPMYRPSDAVEIPVKLAQGTYSAGQVLGELSAQPGTYAAYNDAATNGTQTARCILRYACTVDANGLITLGEHLVVQDVPAFFKGIFNCADLVGLDANAVSDLNGRLWWGDTSTGVLDF